MVVIEDLKKSFGKTEVLKGINLKINHGRAIAVLGPNGSGKTTLIKSLLGLVIPDEGDIFVNGNKIKGKFDYRSDIGYLPQIARFPENLKVLELIRLISDLRGKNPDTNELVREFQLQPFLNQSLGHLSGGTRQKVNVILSLMFNPGLYIFDEPTVGLDPISRVKFREIVHREKKNNKTVILVTHLMSEVEELADDIAFILEGRIVFNGTVAELKESQNEHSLEKAIAKLLSNN